MEKNIYDLMNEVEVNLDEYEVEDFTPLEQKRILSKFWKRKATKSNQYKRYVAVASAAIMSLGAVGALPTLATMNPELYKIANLLGLDKDLEEYSTVVNQPITKEGITIGLGEIVYDRENYKLHVTTYVTTKNPIASYGKAVIHDIHERIYINGENLNTSSVGTTRQIDEYTVAHVISYNIREELQGKLDIKVRIPQLFIGGVEYRNKWTFEFTVDGDKLAQDTQVIQLEEAIGVSDVEEVKLIKFTKNALGMTVYYEQSGRSQADVLELRGEDSFGNSIVFREEGVGTETSGELRLVKEESNLSSEATSLNLRLYICDVPEKDGDFEANFVPVGENINIPLQ